jgi:O-antigen/teichoic acid export membrane protein
LRYFEAIRRTPLFKVTSLNGISVLIKIGIGLIVSKALAIFVGPSGMALVGNLRNFLTSVESVSTLGFQNGIVKYVVESEKKPEEFRKIIATVFISLVVITVVLGSFMFFFSKDLNTIVFGNNFEYSFVFRALALALPWYAISIFLLSVINGLGKFKNVIYINIIGNIIGLLVSVLMVWQYKTFGALLSIVITPSLLFWVTFYFINKEFRFLNTVSFKYFDFGVIKKLSSYSLMALVSAVLGPLVFLAIRKNVIHTVGLEQAGYWETITRISTYYLMFVTTILTVYFLPKLALAKNNAESKKVFWSYYKAIMPLFMIGLIGIYFFRDLIIRILFTKAFLPVSDLFFWQLLGDFFKAASFILGFQFFAKKLTTAFIVTEILSLFVMYVLSNYFVYLYGIQGVVMAHALNYFIYLMVLGIYFRKSLF